MKKSPLLQMQLKGDTAGITEITEPFTALFLQEIQGSLLANSL